MLIPNLRVASFLRCLATAYLSTVISASCAHAWWDTQVMVLKDPPSVAEVEAEKVAACCACIISARAIR